MSVSLLRVEVLTLTRRQEEVEEETGPSHFYVPPEGLLPPDILSPGNLL